MASYVCGGSMNKK